MNQLLTLLLSATLVESVCNTDSRSCLLKYAGSMVRNNCPTLWDKSLDFVMRPFVMMRNIKQPQHYPRECIAEKGKKILFFHDNNPF